MSGSLPPMAPPLLPETKSQPMMDWRYRLREPQWMERYFIAAVFQLCFLTFGFAFLFQ